MTRTIIHPGVRWLPLLAVALTAGCASPHRAAPVPTEIVAFPSSRAVPRVVVYGALANCLPKYDTTPWLERLLYGPNDFGKTSLQNPQGMAVLGDRLLVCDQGQDDVVAINLATGQSVSWCDRRRRPRCPVDVAVGGDNRVYVADTTLGAVLVYDGNGKFKWKLTPTGVADKAFRPAAVYAAQTTLYVGNLAARRVERWDIASHRWLEPVAPTIPGTSMIAPTGICGTPSGGLLIVDAIRGVVWRLAADGTWLNPLGRLGRGTGEFIRPKQVCCTRRGFVFVSDAGRQSVLVFDSQGQFLTEIHRQPDTWPGWTLPTGLVALPVEALPRPSPSSESQPTSPLGQTVIVSDALGVPPLTVLALVETTGNTRHTIQASLPRTTR